MSGEIVNILAFDTAMQSCAVACVEVDDDQSTLRVLAEERTAMSRGQAEELVPMIARVMKKSAQSFADLDRFALSIGPGTFTGLRTGLATARGLGIAALKPVVGVGTLQALAWDLASIQDQSDGNTVPFAIVIDARRGQVYRQLFSPSADALGEPEVLSVMDAVHCLPKGPIYLAGSGAQLLLAAAQDHRSDIKIKQLLDETGPSPMAIAALAVSMEPKDRAPSLLYLRAPDAKPQNHVPLARQ